MPFDIESTLEPARAKKSQEGRITNNRAGNNTSPATERNPTMHIIERHTPHPRFLELTEEVAAGCDPEFDAAFDDLERMFHGTRIQRNDFE